MPYPDNFSTALYDAVQGRDEADDATEIRAAKAALDAIEINLSILQGIETSDSELNMSVWSAADMIEEGLGKGRRAVS